MSENRPETPPQTRLDARYSSPSAAPGDWARAREELTRAELFWLATVRPDGRPHVTPLIAVWHEGALHFTTGADERKARNLAANPEVVMTTGTNTWAEGHDLVVEGRAVRVLEPARLRELARAWESKYGPDWHFEVHEAGAESGFRAQHGTSYVFAVEPRTAFGFAKGEPFGQTRWRFPDGGR
ncbi:pyridoxamine 5'-phosphate oxidase family protein [Streptomyces sp. NA04227]|uniref:pyridoxamine 5'-phosphate oxidase family protein n=1 Tax=Streptomyces sp. NA04227 TaxID=2742136 RepID=UPI0015901AF8|nr:pyridoxamine 5'-phosphate oxidase family protein [Streptomyces sp. NA04227]QKW06124.1 pyridoxamine 5'-phosphate oxidase family protein [Streptomyces sp. NA04227]